MGRATILERLAPLLLIALLFAPRFASARQAAPRPPGDSAVTVPAPAPEALRFQRSGVVLWLIDLAVGLAIPAVVLFTGLSARLQRATRRLGGWYPRLVGYLWLYGILVSLLTLPLAFYQGYLRLHAYGLSTESLGHWARNAILGLLVSGVLGALLIWIPYLLLRRSPHRWWLWSGIAAIPVLIFLLVIAPLWIDPLFNRFTPLADRGLASDIHQLAARAGIPRARIYQVDKSRETRALNAYVTGLGSTERIVLWDTLLDRLDRREILFVTAHEMGHYLLHHTWIVVALGSGVVLLGGWLVDRLARRALGRWRVRFGFDRLEEPASLPLLLLCAQLVLAVFSPALLAVSRAQERAADRYALRLTGDREAAARTFIALQTENLGVPWPPRVLVWLTYTHPPLGERVERALRQPTGR